MTAQYGNTDAFRGASFTSAGFAAATFRDCDMRRIKIVDSLLVDVSVSGDVRNFLVNDVDVTPFVEAQLDRRHLERVQLRAMRTADDFRAMWDTIERLWLETVARAERLPRLVMNGSTASGPSSRRFVTCSSPPTPGQAGRSSTSRCPSTGSASPTPVIRPRTRRGSAWTSSPSYAAVMEARAGRVAVVRGIVDGLTDTELARMCTRAPAPGYPEEARSVGSCLRVVMEEECEHRRYMVRDLAVLDAR
ncbi:DinB family protein [Nonomuraea sediminis]|uniref:DinB family protein n=1 Tax=Nonomuraea sediminis TaxID=2835864 RepID=UPI001BDC7969|nr:DinB family protein [Nonomuraea sediminis]